MPIYEYQCQSCQFELEKLQKLSDPLLTECPNCNESTLKKKISAAGFRLTGSGWYETDFKKNGSKKNLTNSETASSDNASSEGKKAVESSSGEKSEAKASSAEAKPAKNSTSSD